jgi:hypothetical protein
MLLNTSNIDKHVVFTICMERNVKVPFNILVNCISHIFVYPLTRVLIYSNIKGIAWVFVFYHLLLRLKVMYLCNDIFYILECLPFLLHYICKPTIGWVLISRIRSSKNLQVASRFIMNYEKILIIQIKCVVITMCNTPFSMLNKKFMLFGVLLVFM